MKNDFAEIVVTQAIVDAYFKDLTNFLNLDVAIVGGGPAGLVCGYYLAKLKRKVAIFEKKLSIGGGMWGGGMMFNKIVVQKEGCKILNEFEVKYEQYKDNYYLADSIETVSSLCAKTCKAGCKIFNLIQMEDVLIREEKIYGLVINWTATQIANLHVDPLTIKSEFIVDATGHDCEVVKKIQEKGLKLNTSTGKILGEKSMWMQKGEKQVIENTKEVYPGLWVAGMAANAVYGAYRMGPIFGGMILSGKAAAQKINEKL